MTATSVPSTSSGRCSSCGGNHDTRIRWTASSTDLTVPLEFRRARRSLWAAHYAGHPDAYRLRAGQRLSISFDLMQLVPPTADAATPTNRRASRPLQSGPPYLAAGGSCTHGGMACHAASGKAGGIDMFTGGSAGKRSQADRAVRDAEVLQLGGTILNNTDPTGCIPIRTNGGPTQRERP